MKNNLNLFGEVVFSYTRKQAIADGVLVDLSQAEAAQRHWKYPLACTDAVWAIFKDAMERQGCDMDGIIHDLSFIAKLKYQTFRDRADRMVFKASIAGRSHTFKFHIGSGDKGEPVLTLMLPHED